MREMLVVDWAPKGALLYYITWFRKGKERKEKEK